MAKKVSWLVLEELLERGDPSFVTELRKLHDAEQLGGFASRWIADRRPWARQFLFDYLNLPLNAYRHEPLVKRLFKLAEKAGDDEVMGRFLVALDRSVRRVKLSRKRFLRGAFATRPEAHAWMQRLNDLGADSVHLQELDGRYQVMATWYRRTTSRVENRYTDRRDEAESLLAGWKKEAATYGSVIDHGGPFQVHAVLTGESVHPRRGTTMPRDETYSPHNPKPGAERRTSTLRTRFGLKAWPEDLDSYPERFREKFQRLRLFSIHTRNYLRRRAWRYFRRLGKQHPERYVPALAEALNLYTDEDTADGLAFLDNWGLVHVLFHHCPALAAKPTGWTVAPERTLAQLAPAPMYEALWLAAPRSLLALLQHAQSRPVRQWAIHLIRRDPTAVFRQLPLDELLDLLRHEDADVVTLVAEALERTPGLDLVPLDRWLALLESSSATGLDLICGLISRHVRPERVSFTDAVRLASSRPVPVARLGLLWLEGKAPQTEEDCQTLLGLAEAQAEPLRADIVRLARRLLSASPHFRPAWVLEYLDSRHEDVRSVGWDWLQDETRAREVVELWRRLLESPYDDVRLKLVADLQVRAARDVRALDERVALVPELVRYLWASVLLNIHRGNRHKQPAVGQIVRRLSHRPQEARELLPILSVALRSLRGPEWRAGLTGIVQVIVRRPELEPDVRGLFPELRM